VTTRIAQAQYRRAAGGNVTLVVDKYENEPDFQSYAITRFVDPHDPSVAAFAGFDVRSELVDLLHGDLADGASPGFEEAKAVLLSAFDVGQPV
jgi:hypothetical protein